MGVVAVVLLVVVRGLDPRKGHVLHQSFLKVSFVTNQREAVSVESNSGMNE